MWRVRPRRFVRIAEAAARRNLLVMLVCHRLTTHSTWGTKWTGGEMNLEHVYWSWDKLAAALCGRGTDVDPLHHALQSRLEQLLECSGVLLRC